MHKQDPFKEIMFLAWGYLSNEKRNNFPPSHKKDNQ